MSNEYIEKRNAIVREIIDYCSTYTPENAFSIFLCGGASRESSRFRFALGKAIEETQSKKSVFSVYYPETLFSELLYGCAKRNLLDLEEELANTVSAIVLPLQSPGTFAELGAFSSNDLLKRKIIVINNKKYRRDRSFINDGPIALLEKKNIIYDDMRSDKKSISTLNYEIRKRTKLIPRINVQKRTLFELRFILCVLIYVFDPISKKDLRDYVIDSEVFYQEEIKTLDSAFGILGTNGYVHTTSKLEYIIDPKSFYQFLRKIGYNRDEIDQFQSHIDSYRMRALNCQLRKK